MLDESDKMFSVQQFGVMLECIYWMEKSVRIASKAVFPVLRDDLHELSKSIDACFSTLTGLGQCNHSFIRSKFTIGSCDKVREFAPGDVGHG